MYRSMQAKPRHANDEKSDVESVLVTENTGYKAMQLQKPRIWYDQSMKLVKVFRYPFIFSLLLVVGFLYIALNLRGSSSAGGGEHSMVTGEDANHETDRSKAEKLFTGTSEEQVLKRNPTMLPDEGYRFYGQIHGKNGTPPDKEVFYTLFRYPQPLRNGVFLEMGALDGVLYSNSLFFEKELGWTGVLIEASGFNFPKLMQNRPNPDVHKLHMAVCSPAGYVTMVGSAESAGVDNIMTDQKRKTFEHKWLNESRVPQKVPCKPLADILEPVGITKLDLFSLDVEGSELIVLNAIDFGRIKIRSILFEMNIQCYDPNDNRPLSFRRNLCDEVLRNHGFCMVFKGMNQLWVSGDLMHHCRISVGEANPSAVETKDQVSLNQISTIIQEPATETSASASRVLEKRLEHPSWPDEGYKFYGQVHGNSGTSPDKEVFYTLFRYPQPLRNGVFLEMGALDGVLYSNSLFFEKELGWTGVLIEASGFNFPKLMQNRPNPDVHKLHMAVCSPAGYVTMVGSAESAGVDNIMTDQKRKTFEHKWLNESRVPQKVPCKPLADILEPVGITKLDLFSLDVEGSELIVLNAIDFGRIKIRSILFEMNIQCYDPNDNRPLSFRRNLCDEVLRNHGFCMVFKGMNQLWVSDDELKRHCMKS